MKIAVLGLGFMLTIGTGGADLSAGGAKPFAPAEVPFGESDQPFFSEAPISAGVT